MRIKNKTISALGLMACTFSLSSCDSDSDDEIILQHPTALVTVYPSTSEGFILQLDDSTSLVPTNLKTSPFGEKKVRALVNYSSFGFRIQAVIAYALRAASLLSFSMIWKIQYQNATKLQPLCRSTA